MVKRRRDTGDSRPEVVEIDSCVSEQYTKAPLISSVKEDSLACQELMKKQEVKVGKKRYIASVEHTSTANEDGYTMDDTTYEVDYASIILQKHMPWFMREVALLDAAETHFPEQSHGFDKQLANIHRAHPKLKEAWANDDGIVSLYEIVSYESAGVWIESSGEACLVIWATYDDNDSCIRLLYPMQLRKCSDDIKEEGEWVVVDTGEGSHLEDMGTWIKCDNKTQGPFS